MVKEIVVESKELKREKRRKIFAAVAAAAGVVVGASLCGYGAGKQGAKKVLDDYEPEDDTFYDETEDETEVSED